MPAAEAQAFLVRWQLVKRIRRWQAHALVALLRSLPAKVNLIPFNPWPGAPYATSEPATVKAFSDILFEAGISAPIRRPRGRDIMAACGQLKSASERRRRGEAESSA